MYINPHTVHTLAVGMDITSLSFKQFFFKKLFQDVKRSEFPADL